MRLNAWKAGTIPLFLLLAACGSSSAPTGASKAGVELPPAEDRPEPQPEISGRFPKTNQEEDTACLSGDQTVCPTLTHASKMGYRKGLRTVGVQPINHQVAGIPRGQNFQLGWIGECAYVGTADMTQYVAHRYYMTPVVASAEDPSTGMAVIDASNPTNPTLVQIIPNPQVVTDTGNLDQIPNELPPPNTGNPAGMLSNPPNTHRVMAMNWFAIATHEKRRIIVAGAHTLLGVFDATDCRHPVLKSTIDLHHENVAVHGLRFSPDGYRVYVSGVLTFDATAVIDLGDLANPKILKTWPHGAHDITLNADETRMYMNSLTVGTSSVTGGGLRIVDISALAGCVGGHSGHEGHESAPPPADGCSKAEFKEVSHYRWTGLSHAHEIGTIKGRKYAFSVDEYSTDQDRAGGTTLCSPGWIRILDVTDEENVDQVGEIKLGVSGWDNCRNTNLDGATYNTHYLTLDDENDTKLVFVSWYASGLRVFDVTDPSEPREVAYLIPPPVPNKVYDTAFASPTADSTISHIRWRPELGQIWVVNVNGGFSILEFTQSAELPGSGAGPQAGSVAPGIADDALEPGLQGEVPLADQVMRAAIPGTSQAYSAAGSALPPAQAYRRGTHLAPQQPLRVVDPLTGLARGANAEIAWLDDCAYMGVGDPVRRALNEQVQQGSATPLPAAPKGPLQASMAPGVFAYVEAGGDERGDDGDPKPKGCEGGLPTGGDPCNLPDPPADLPQDGLAIISAKNPREPSLVYTIQLRITPRSPVIGGPTPTPPTEARTSTATANPWEALQSNQARRMFMVGSANEVATYQAVYNCKYPSRRSILNLGAFTAHGMRIAPDGNTSYLTDQNADGVAGAPLLVAVDTTNLRKPAVIASYSDPQLGTAGFHNVEISADGRRAYVTYANAATTATLMGGGDTGLVVLDLSDVQARVKAPQIRKIGQLDWSGSAHGVRRANVAGRNLLLVTDNIAGVSSCPWGGVHLIDIANEAAPKELGAFGLAVNDVANCMTTMADNAVYTAHSVSVDDPDNTRYAFFGWANSGMRVFDLAAAGGPVEVAYYNPPPYSDTLNHDAGAGVLLDSVISSVRYRPESNQVWFASSSNGFHVLQLTRSMGPVK